MEITGDGNPTALPSQITIGQLAELKYTSFSCGALKLRENKPRHLQIFSRSPINRVSLCKCASTCLLEGEMTTEPLHLGKLLERHLDAGVVDQGAKPLNESDLSLRVVA